MSVDSECDTTANIMPVGSKAARLGDLTFRQPLILTQRFWEEAVPDNSEMPCSTVGPCRLVLQTEIVRPWEKSQDRQLAPYVP
jgi:hypothetical protein